MRDRKISPSAFSASDWQLICARLYAPDIELAENVGSFPAGLECLRDLWACFSPQRRFLLHEAEGNNCAASQAKLFVQHFERMRLLGVEIPPEFREGNAEAAFLRGVEREYAAFVNMHYPWLDWAESSPPASSVSVDGILDEKALSRMGVFGFSPVRTNAPRKTWRCVSGVLGPDIVLTFEKRGAPAYVIEGTIAVPRFAYENSLAYPFYFSSASFPWGGESALERIFADFFEGYAKVFPLVLEALGRGIGQTKATVEALRSRAADGV